MPIADLKLFLSPDGAGGNPKGSKTTVGGKDAARTDDGSKLSTIPGEGVYGSKSGGQVEIFETIPYSKSNGLTFGNPGSWNETKTIKLVGDGDLFSAYTVAVLNYVHAEVNLRHGTGGVTTRDQHLIVDGAKRGSITTGDGNDTIHLGISSNGGTWSELFTFNTGKGDDVIVFMPASPFAVVGSPFKNYTDGRTSLSEIRTGAGDDVVNLSKLSSTDFVFLGAGDDQAHGGGGNDVIEGDAGNDLIFGGSGNDIQNGEGGNDTLVGGLGNDIMIGGKGADVFLFTPVEGIIGYDVILDFEAGKDKVDATAYDYTIAQMQSFVKLSGSDVILAGHNWSITFKDAATSGNTMSIATDFLL